MHSMMRHLMIAAALLSLSACGNTDLTARGSVLASFGGTERAYNFTQNTRLEAPEGSAGIGFITGSCEMARIDAETWGVVVEIRGGQSPDDDTPLSSVTIMQRTDREPGTGSVEAVIGTSTYTSDLGSGCSLEIPYAESDSGMVGLVGDCGVATSDGEEATVSVELDLIGCTVLE